MQWFAALLVALGVSAPLQAEAPPPKGCVVLLHGLARSDDSLELAASVLERAGYLVVNEDYPSTGATIPELAEAAIGPSRAACAAVSDAPPFALTHSMGGILLRWWAKQNPDAPWQRVVMLAPPNQGSELVDALQDLQPFALINGPAGQQLSTAPDALPRSLGTPFLPACGEGEEGRRCQRPALRKPVCAERRSDRGGNCGRSSRGPVAQQTG